MHRARALRSKVNNDVEKFSAWRVNFHVKFHLKNRYGTFRDSCDTGFSVFRFFGFYLSGSEFFLNRIATVAHICKHNKQFFKHNIMFWKHNTVFLKHNTIFWKHNTKLSKHNTKLSKHNTKLSKHNTKLSKHNTKLLKHNYQCRIDMPLYNV